MTQAAPLDLYDHILHLADHGNSFDALPLLEGLKDNPTPSACVLAARVLRHCGGRRRGDALIELLWRRHPSDPDAMVAYLRTITDRYGHYRGWEWSERNALPDHATAPQRAEWLAHRANLAALQRDWARAGALIEEAHRLWPDSPWIHVEHASVLEREDRYAEAIGMAERGCALNPNFRSAIQSAAHLYTLTGRDREALRLLDDASARMQSSDVEAQRYLVATELEDHEAALAALHRSRAFAPRAVRAHRAWFDANEADTLLRLGRYEEAASVSRRLADQPFHARLIEKLDAVAAGGEAPRRVQLHVGFVRQHHQTCAPATLSAIAGYWGRSAEHVEIAEEICYDGTPAPSERAWAERHGFVTREFTVNWEVATRLIDAGIPFTLTTQFVSSGHLQAVIGYDALRGTLLIRDPFQRVFGEFDPEPLFEQNRFSGPRGMVLIPQEAVYRLDGIVLPDAESWDSYYATMRALEVHDRETAASVTEAQNARAPDHWLTDWCYRGLAHYDGSTDALLARTDALIARFGEVPSLVFYKSRLLESLGEGMAAMRLIESGVARQPWNAELLTRLAQLQTSDARLLPQAERNVRRALRVQPSDAEAWRTRATTLWVAGDKHAALAHYRAAACLGEFNEDHAVAYFQACVGLGRASDGFEFLAQRVERLGARSSAPAINYFNQLDSLERGPEGFAVLERAMARRPDDALLRHAYAERLLTYGEVERARTLLAEAGGYASQISRLRVVARLARHDNRLDEAWDAISLACEQDPLNIGLRHIAVDILGARSGEAEVLRYLRALCERHPASVGLHELLLQRLPADVLLERHDVLRHMLSLHPGHAMFQRELTLNLAAQQRMEDATSAARLARELAPNHSRSYALLGYLHQLQGDMEQAHAQYREALRRSVDDIGALVDFVRTQPGLEGRREALRFAGDQLREQATQGMTVLTYQELGTRVFTDEALTGELETFREWRPDLWTTWVALALQHADKQRFDDAAAILDAAIERFPLTPRVHYEKARVDANRRRFDGAMAGLRRTLQIAPAWDWPIRLFVEIALRENGDPDAALVLLDAPQSRSDESAECQVLRARVLWKMARQDEALDRLEAMLQRWPGHAQAWTMLADWSAERGQTDRALHVAQALAAARPDNIDVWLRVAGYTSTPEAALAALERADALDPRNQQAYVCRIDALIRFGRLDDALAAIDSSPWGAYTPLAVRRRRPDVLWRQGNREGAVTELRALLEKEPNDVLLWQDLADASLKLDRIDQSGAAGREMVRINPGYAVGYGYVGNAARRQSQWQAAIDAYRTAFEIDPEYEFAAFGLADLLLDSAEWDDAWRVVATLRTRYPGPSSAYREVRLAMLAEEPSRVPVPLNELVRAPEAQAGLFEDIAKRMTQGIWQQLLRDALIDGCKAGEASIAACRHWLGMEYDIPHAALIERLAPYLEADRKNHLKIAVVEAAGAAKQLRHVTTLMSQYDTALRGDAQCWGAVSFALINGERHAAMIGWMHDWMRDDAPYWALDNLAIALRYQGDLRLAHDVAARSHRLEPRGGSAGVWLAADAARDNDIEALGQWLDKLGQVDVHGWLRPLVELLTAFHKSASVGKATLFVLQLRRTAKVRESHQLLGALAKDLRRCWIMRGGSVGRRFWRLLTLPS
ncbi:tetratricopeptide repeat protein [Cupriavidus pauculus]|uniref:Tetratricopeptide repeat protein n=1 Tax=Cupriavidus pauculus TaxID=82633 RepID=A0A5P2HCB0_9BURK|nr:tetratricopeptide repeat protein [Cupriavidus pauculus]QET04849.1 tetratricopeptide repeat protein [Cupriavidus pauculus]